MYYVKCDMGLHRLSNHFPSKCVTHTHVRIHSQHAMSIEQQQQQQYLEKRSHSTVHTAVVTFTCAWLVCWKIQHQKPMPLRMASRRTTVSTKKKRKSECRFRSVTVFYTFHVFLFSSAFFLLVRVMNFLDRFVEHHRRQTHIYIYIYPTVPQFY